MGKGKAAVITVTEPVTSLETALIRTKVRQSKESVGPHRHGSATSKTTGFAASVPSPTTSPATLSSTDANTATRQATSLMHVDSFTPTSKWATPPKIDNQHAPSPRKTLIPAPSNTAGTQKIRQNSKLTNSQSRFPHPSTPTSGQSRARDEHLKRNVLAIPDAAGR